MRRCTFFSIAALMCLSFSAEAQSLLTDLANDYKAATAGWMSAAQVYALRLFYRLVAIEIAVFAIWNLFQRDSLAEFMASLLVQLLGVLFFWVLIQEAPVWIPTIIQSFIAVGKSIGTATLDPASIINSGIELACAMLKVKAGLFSAPLVVATASLSTIGVVIAYLIVSAELSLTMAEFYIVGSAGILLLGFSGSRWTQFVSEGYLGAVLRIGIKLFTLYLVLGLGLTLVPKFLDLIIKAMAAGGLPDVSAYLSVLAGSAMLALIAWRVPNLAAGMIGGEPSLSFGAAAGLALTAASMSHAVTRGIVQAQSITSASARAAEGQARLQGPLLLLLGV